MSRNGALAGMRVIELAAIGPVPFPASGLDNGALMAELGASIPIR